MMFLMTQGEIKEAIRDQEERILNQIKRFDEMTDKEMGVTHRTLLTRITERNIKQAEEKIKRLQENLH